MKKIKKINKEENVNLIGQKEDYIRYLELQVDSLKNKIASLERSATWHFIQRIDKLIEVLLPKESKLRKWYYSLIEFNQRLINKDKSEKMFTGNINSLEENILSKIELLKPFKDQQFFVFDKNYKSPLYKKHI